MQQFKKNKLIGLRINYTMHMYICNYIIKKNKILNTSYSTFLKFSFVVGIVPL